MTRDSAGVAGPQPDRRPMIGVVVLLAGAAVLGLVAAGRPWATAIDPAALTAVATSVSGTDLVPFASPVFLVALAAALVVPVMQVVGRRIVGTVVALLALALVVASMRVAADLDGAARRFIGGGNLAVTTSVAWPIGTAVVAAVVAVAAVLIIVGAPAWPGLSTRYERRSARRASSDAERNRGRDTWDALDRGDDPTS